MNDISEMNAGVRRSAEMSQTMRRAVAYAQQRSHRYVTLEHLLLALADDADAVSALRSAGADMQSLKGRALDVVNRALSTLYAPGGHELRPSYKLERILETAAEDAAKSKSGEVDGAFVLAALTGESDSLAAGLLRQHGLGFQQATAWLLANRNGAPAPRSHLKKATPPAPRQHAASPAQSAPPLSSWQAPPPVQPPQAQIFQPKLEDMLNSARQILDAEEGGAPPERRANPPAARAAEERQLRIDPNFPAIDPPQPAMPGPQAMRPEPGFERQGQTPTRARPAFEPERKLRKALENVKPAEGEAPAPEIRNLPALRPQIDRLSGNIPARMRRDKAETVEIRLSREETQALFQSFEGRMSPNGGDAIVTRAVTIMLRAPESGFTIQSLSPETQWVFDRPSFLESERFGRWRWLVTPSARGKGKLQLTVSARSVDDNGMASDSAMPDQLMNIYVRRNYLRGFGRMLRLFLVLLAGAVLGKMAEIFGPQLLPLLLSF